MWLADTLERWDFASLEIHKTDYNIFLENNLLQSESIIRPNIDSQNQKNFQSTT